jgi:hypothetical protein
VSKEAAVVAIRLTSSTPCISKSQLEGASIDWRGKLGFPLGAAVNARKETMKAKVSNRLNIMSAETYEEGLGLG